jgi:CRISPR-associated protein Cas2
MQRRPAIVAYDISDNRKRRAALRILREWRLDGQKSVHECLLTDAEAAELVIQLSEVIDNDTDRLLLAWVTPQRNALARGRGRVDALQAMLRHVA